VRYPEWSELDGNRPPDKESRQHNTDELMWFWRSFDTVAAVACHDADIVHAVPSKAFA